MVADRLTGWELGRRGGGWRVAGLLGAWRLALGA